MTEIPMPDEISERSNVEDKDCCDRICECWLQIICVLVLLAITIGILSSLFSG